MFDVNEKAIEEKIQQHDELLAKDVFSLQSEPTVRPIAQAINDISEEEYPGVELYLDGLLFRF